MNKGMLYRIMENKLSIRRERNLGLFKKKEIPTKIYIHIEIKHLLDCCSNGYELEWLYRPIEE